MLSLLMLCCVDDGTNLEFKEFSLGSFVFFLSMHFVGLVVVTAAEIVETNTLSISELEYSMFKNY